MIMINITTQEVNKLTSKYFTTILVQANLARKIEIANIVKKIDLKKCELYELSKKVKVISKKD